MTIELFLAFFGTLFTLIVIVLVVDKLIPRKTSQPYCSKCGHAEDAHEVEEDNAFCLTPHCSCKEFRK